METFVDTALHNALLAVPLAVLALSVGLVVRRPALVHVLWILVLLRFVMPPLWRVEVPRPFASIEPATAEVALDFGAVEPQPTDAAETPRLDSARPAPRMEPQDGPTAVVEAGAPAAARLLPPQTIQPDPIGTSAMLGFAQAVSWRQVLGSAWLASALGLLAVSLGRAFRFSVALRAASPAPPSVQRLAREIAGRIGARRTPRIVLVRGHLSPMLWCCLGTPKIILPEDLWRRLDPMRQSTLLAHELAHFQRRDHWIRALELIAGALFWWHPVVWIARRQLREAEERCCDAWVVWALPEARRDYATALVDAVGFLSEDRSVLPAFASGVGQVRHLRGRLTMIMRGDTPRRLPRLALAGLMTGGLALATFGAGFAQERRDDRPGGERRPDKERRRDDERRAEERQPPRDELDPKIREELEKARRDFEQARQRLEELERRFGRGRERERERSRDRAPDTRPVPPLPPRPGSGPGFTPRADQPIERRMEELERRMEMMLRQLDEMRRMLRRGPDRNQGGPGELERGGKVRERDLFEGDAGGKPKISR